VISLQRALLCGASILVMAVPALAQESVETVTVTGIRASLRDSLSMKLNTDVITENISTKDIGQLPDVTIAEELNRLPGLNTTRDRGNASQAAVRGLGPRLVLGLVNGREVASSEPDQNVRWEIYPSEIVGGATVYKSQIADIISGGIAATIDIKTRSALDYDGPAFSLRLGPQYNDEAQNIPHYDGLGFRGSASYITHLTSNFAISLAGSFQREKNGYTNFHGWGYNLANSGNAGDVTGDNIPDSLPWGAQTQVTMITQDRMALAGSAEWAPTSNLIIKADGLFSAYTVHENDLQAWYADGLGGWIGSTGTTPCSGGSASWFNCAAGANNGNIVVQDGVVVGGDLSGWHAGVRNVIALYGERHNLAVGGINAQWNSGPWNAKLDLSHSEAFRTNQWQSIYSVKYPQNMHFDWGLNHAPVVTVSGSGAASVSDPTAQATEFHYFHPNTWDSWGTNGVSAGPEHTRDHISSIQGDLGRDFSDSFLKSVAVGFHVSDRAKNHQTYNYNLCPNSDSYVKAAPDWTPCNYQNSALTDPYTVDTYVPLTGLESFKVHGVNVPDMIYGNYADLARQVYGSTSPPLGSDDLPSHWRVHESVYEAYAMAKFEADIGVPVSGNFGVRVVDVETSSQGYANGLPIALSKGYTKVLPSATVNFHVADDQVIRLGASIAMARPPLDELRTGYSLTTTPPYTGSGGNPFLNPYMAKQIDLGYEWYFHDESLFAAAIYYKNLDSFIGYASTHQVINGQDYVMYSPANAKGGEVTGMELTFQTRFYFLPGFLQDFGTYSNYAYVNSGVKELTPVGNPFEATGLAKHTAEFDLWYQKGGLEARVAYKVHSPFTIIAGWNSQSLSRLDWERYLDASVSYQVNDMIGIRLQGRNLTNAISRSYYDNNRAELNRYDIFGRSYLFDVSVKF
jgi:iron complex outermembrane recepter protein